VFTARYALSPYIKQIRFVFKGLNWSCAVRPFIVTTVLFQRTTGWATLSILTSHVLLLLLVQLSLCLSMHLTMKRNGGGLSSIPPFVITTGTLFYVTTRIQSPLRPFSHDGKQRQRLRLFHFTVTWYRRALIWCDAITIRISLSYLRNVLENIPLLLADIRHI
jgi:hypothetical protein